MAMLRFKCPSCDTKFAAVESSDTATQVVRRTCRKCGERWQLIVTCMKQSADIRLDKADFVFLGHKR